MTTEDRKRAFTPEELTALVVERANAGDVDGVALLYEPDAVLAYPPGEVAVGRDAISAVYRRVLADAEGFERGLPLPTVHFEDIALTSTRAADTPGIRVQVVRRQPDGTWLRIIDRPVTGD